MGTPSGLAVPGTVLVAGERREQRGALLRDLLSRDDELRRQAALLELGERLVGGVAGDLPRVLVELGRASALEVDAIDLVEAQHRLGGPGYPYEMLHVADLLDGLGPTL